MPSKVIKEVVDALKREFRGKAIDIPIAMREEPAVTLFPGLVEEQEPAKTNATALGGFENAAPMGNPLAGLDAPPMASESLSGASGGVSDDPLFAPEDPSERNF